jgi:hypothetical protein
MLCNLPRPEPPFRLRGFCAKWDGVACNRRGGPIGPDVGARAAKPNGLSPWPTEPKTARRRSQAIEPDDRLTFCVVAVFSIRMRATIRFATVLVLVLSLGLHWAFLQSVAWVGMIVSYSHDASLAEAVSKTFDGKHPCCLCKMIQKGRADEKQQEQKQKIKPGSKLDVALVWRNPAFEFADHRAPIPSRPIDAPSRREAPPKPRPRCPCLDNLA